MPKNPFKDFMIENYKKRIANAEKMLAETEAPAVRRGLEAFINAEKRALKFWRENL